LVVWLDFGHDGSDVLLLFLCCCFVATLWELSAELSVFLFEGLDLLSATLVFDFSHGLWLLLSSVGGDNVLVMLRLVHVVKYSRLAILWAFHESRCTYLFGWINFRNNSGHAFLGVLLLLHRYPDAKFSFFLFDARSMLPVLFHGGAVTVVTWDPGVVEEYVLRRWDVWEVNKRARGKVRGRGKREVKVSALLRRRDENGHLGEMRRWSWRNVEFCLLIGLKA
jgi:hypothetical protein